jgi:hypothetical protein
MVNSDSQSLSPRSRKVHDTSVTTDDASSPRSNNAERKSAGKSSELENDGGELDTDDTAIKASSYIVFLGH